MTIVDAVIIYCKKKLDFSMDDSNESMAKSVAYNIALDDVLEFIKNHRSGDIDQEYLQELKKQQNS